MPFKDMREFLAHLDSQGQLKQVDVELNCEIGEENEMQALMRLVCEQDGPALMLNNLKGYNTPQHPVMFNVFGTRERTAMTIDEIDPLAAKLKHAGTLGDVSKWH